MTGAVTASGGDPLSLKSREACKDILLIQGGLELFSPLWGFYRIQPRQYILKRNLMVPMTPFSPSLHSHSS